MPRRMLAPLLFAAVLWAGGVARAQRIVRAVPMVASTRNDATGASSVGTLLVWKYWAAAIDRCSRDSVGTACDIRIMNGDAGRHALCVRRPRMTIDRETIVPRIAAPQHGGCGPVEAHGLLRVTLWSPRPLDIGRASLSFLIAEPIGADSATSEEGEFAFAAIRAP